jgi:hypothetical protein
MASQLKVDTITGVATAGSIAVTAEGNSTTTNLQQGLAKSWADFSMASTPSADDSFNLASITDSATGKMGINATNIFASVNYVPTGYSNGTTGDNFDSTTQIGLKQGQNVTTSTTTYEFSCYASSAYTDAIHNYTLTVGDLA